MEPTQHSRFTPSQLNSQLLNQPSKDRRNKWRKFLQTSDHRTGARKVWKVVRSLNGSGPVVGRHPIQFESKTISSDTDKGKAFNKQFTNARIHGSDKLLRKTRHETAKLTLLNNPTFYPLRTKQTIADSKPSLSEIMSLSENIIPQMWKNSKIIPLPKPEKDHKLSTSYRPISLLCPAVKILERLIHPFFSQSISLPPHINMVFVVSTTRIFPH